jgi:hypothetical protein
MNATIERLLRELTDEICHHERSAGCGSLLVLVPYDSTLSISVYESGKPIDISSIGDGNPDDGTLIAVDTALNERIADRVTRQSKG